MRRCGWKLSAGLVDVTRITSKLPHFDVCVIGGGPAGIAAALRAVDYKKRVCLVEAQRIGGADLWNGTLQSKTLWEMSKYVSRLSDDVMRRVFEDDVLIGVQKKVSDERVLRTLQEVSVTRELQLLDALRSADVKLIFGKGMFSSPYELDVHCNETGEYLALSADYYVIATGAVPHKHPYIVTDGRRVVTTNEIMQLPIPNSLVIIGAGAVGCEFASIYANLGRTKISLIDKATRVLPTVDEDVSEFIEMQLVRRGVKIHHSCTLFDMEPWGNDEKGGCVYSVRRNDADGTNPVEIYEAERALVTVGRIPNLAQLGLGNTLCKVTDGRIVVDALNRCLPHKHIYAIGDAANGAFVNLGEAQGRGAIDHMYSEKQERTIDLLSLSNLSSILFIEEELASVGLNEQQCRARNLSHIVARYGYGHLSRAIAMGNTTGFCKVIVTNDREKRLLGVCAVGAHAGSIVEVASLSIRRCDSAYELLKLTSSYPSVVQGFVECIRMILGRSACKPNTTPDMLLKVWNTPHFDRGRVYVDDVSHEEPLAERKELQRAKMINSVIDDALKERAGIMSGNNADVASSKSSDGCDGDCGGH